MDDDALGVIAHLTMTHSHSSDDDDARWDDYLVQLDERTFRVRLGRRAPDPFEAIIHERLRPRRGDERTAFRRRIEAGSWHAAYCRAIDAIVSGVVTGDWLDAPATTPLIAMTDTPAWQRRASHLPETNG